MVDAGSLHVLSDEESDLGAALRQVGIPIAPPGSAAVQDIQAFALPFGLPVRWVGLQEEAQVASYRWIRRSIRSGGYLLVGFNNRWSVRNTPSRYHASTPRRMKQQLQRAGFRSVRFFGAMPDLNVPEYIFDLESRALRFALLHRLRHKPVLLSILRIFSGPLGMRSFVNFLPCYFVVATA
jgi:hypothetical protein